MGSETLQRRIWDRVYDRLAGLYDAVDWLTGNTTHRLRQRVWRYLPGPGSRVLELGFGTGRLHLELAAQYKLAGVDLAPGMARLTQRRLAANGQSSLLCVGSADALPCSDGSFDAVLSTFAFSAIPDAGRALDEMVRVTTPKGEVIIVDAGEAEDGNLVAHLLARFWEAFGDFMRDEVPLMKARDLAVEREDYGPWGSVHVVVGRRTDGKRGPC
jgi:ubiquinone/menaquinone biosynthesis C-methylase UbiE